MSRYAGYVEGITPNTSNDNLALDAAANESCKILEVSWGGEVTTSTAMRTRVARSASGATPTAGNVQRVHPNSPANLVTFASGWTTQPTLSAGGLLILPWNANGGVIRWLAGPGEEFVLLGAAHISMRNGLGTAASTYGCVWEED